MYNITFIYIYIHLSIFILKVIDTTTIIIIPLDSLLLDMAHRLHSLGMWVAQYTATTFCTDKLQEGTNNALLY